MPNRKVHPDFNTIKKININQAVEKNLSNGVPLYLIKAGEQDVVKVDFLFDAGNIYSENPLIPMVTNSLTNRGTKKYSSTEIAELIDFYGAFLDFNVGKHVAQITLYTLNKYFEKTIEIIAEMLFNSNFPNEEIDLFLQNKNQEYLISRQKTEFLSKEIFLKTIYGENHPYGRQIELNDFKNIDRKTIKDFFDEYYNINTMKIVLAGNYKQIQLDLLENYFGKTQIIKKSEIDELDFSIKIKNDQKYYHEIENSIQSSLRIGKISVNKHHPDYFFINITSILLGGYFGSRLMTNIREDKGYTYGIYSSNMSMLHSGIFVISAESGKNVYKQAIEEIYKELKTLRTIPVSDKELQKVKNWIMGNMTKLFDGPFALSDAFKSLLVFNLGYEYYDRYFEAIQKIQPENILEIADKYMQEDSMFEIVVGSI